MTKKGKTFGLKMGNFGGLYLKRSSEKTFG